MVLAVVLGLLFGLGGTSALLFGSIMAKRATNTSNLGHAGALILGVLISTLLLAIPLIVCAISAKHLLVYFALAEVAALICSAVGYGIYTFVRK